MYVLADDSSLIFFSNFIQVLLDLLLSQLSEFRIITSYDADFNFSGLEVESQNGRQARDSHLDGFNLIVVDLLLELLFQIAVSFGLFHANGDGAEAAVVASRIGLVDARAELIIESDEDHRASQRSHLGILRVHLSDVGDATTKNVHRHFIPVLILPVGGFILSALYLRLTIGDLSSHYASNAFCNPRHMTDGLRIDELIGNLLLGGHHSDVLSLHSNRSVSLLIDCFKGIL